LAPKLNSHCWYDIKLAAAKKPLLKKTKKKFKKFNLRQPAQPAQVLFHVNILLHIQLCEVVGTNICMPADLIVCTLLVLAANATNK
jgi:hypothetical protein